MSSIYFATTNQNKLTEASQILKMEVKGCQLDIPEIQSLSFEEVALNKARSYFQEFGQPIFVEDSGLVFNALNGLPGPLTKHFSESLGNEGLIKLLSGFSDKKAQAISVLVYMDEKGNSHTFDGIIDGSISSSPQGKNGFGWDPIFIPAGYKETFAQLNQDEKNQISMRRLALEKLKNFLK